MGDGEKGKGKRDEEQGNEINGEREGEGWNRKDGEE